METNEKYPIRTYRLEEVCYFYRNTELNGGLSNMASGYPIEVNNVPIMSTEALYQACRFPHLPEVQQKIIAEHSPKAAKMACQPFRDASRPDWENIRVDIMYWCLKLKLAQNFISFGGLLESTGDRPIVEYSTKDAFWGAMPDGNDENILTGVNMLGILLTKLRQEYHSADQTGLLSVSPPAIPGLMLYGEAIQTVFASSP